MMRGTGSRRCSKAPTVTIGYDDANHWTSVTYSNTNSITYAYNAASELTSLIYKNGATTLGYWTYTYDLAGNRIKAGRRVRCESMNLKTAVHLSGCRSF